MLDFITPKRVKILAVILCMMLIIGLVCCSGPKDTPTETEPPVAPTEVLPSDPDPIVEPETIPPHRTCANRGQHGHRHRR